ncbi:hypothetical protein CS022_18385 [Veronia nyctiphanis]|uniref:Uncharacterized protein n=1 Tax=Veronia nyctiphanis TaxID=1278244 RepID=A0A4Q0YS89_9GAMM|nr:hypothetical protein [Veronia nyctiphanis]RXJ71969.1 hypothetical protein CS022_18385 [Veronia nyctiphanis]
MWRLTLLDIKQRLRAQSVWIAILITVTITCFLFPGEKAGYRVIDINGYRGIYNSAWIGASLALVGSYLLSLFGYYWLSGSIDKDRQDRMLELIRTTGQSPQQYLLVRWIGHVFYLTLLALASLIAASILQYFLSPESPLVLSDYVLPFLLLILPSIFLTSAFILLMDTLQKPGATAKNWLYFLLWSLIAALGLTGFSAHTLVTTGMENDFAHLGMASSGSISIGFTPLKDVQEIVTWQGLKLSFESWLPVLYHLMATSVLVVMSLMRAKQVFLSSPSVVSKQANAAKALSKQTMLTKGLTKIRHFPSDLLALVGSSRFRAEVRFVEQTLNSRLFLTALGVSALSLLLPISAIQNGLLAVAVMIPVLMLARLHTVDAQSNIKELLKTTGQSGLQRMLRPLAMFYLVNLLLAGITLRFAIAGEITALLHWLAFLTISIFLPFLLASLTHSNKLFELTFISFWVAGILNKEPMADFVGVSGSEVAMTNTLMIAGFSVLASLMLTMVGNSGGVWRMKRIK